MNGIFQMQGGKNLILLGLSLAGNLEKPLMSLNGTEWRERGYGLRRVIRIQRRIRIRIRIGFQMESHPNKSISDMTSASP
jgi:hypothetical protein